MKRPGSVWVLTVLLGTAACEPLVGPSLQVLAPDAGADAAADAPPVDAAVDVRDAPVDAPVPDTRPPDVSDARRDAAPDLQPDLAPDSPPDRGPDAPQVDAPIDSPVPDMAPPDTLACPGAQIACNGRCLSVEADPDNCGGCDKPCSSGLCAASTCQMPGAGHLVIIGHDYAATSSGPSNLLGNAVLLASRAPTRILAYEGAAAPAAVQSANDAITQVAGGRGRVISVKVALASEVVAQLPNHEVFLIHAQTAASDAALDQLGTTWANAMVAFVAGGKTIVLLDGVSASNSGTLRVLSASGLFAGSARTAVATGQTLSVVSAADPVARNVPASYDAPATSTAFQTQEVVKVVQTAGGAPVVVHRVF